METIIQKLYVKVVIFTFITFTMNIFIIEQAVLDECMFQTSIVFDVIAIKTFITSSRILICTGAILNFNKGTFGFSYFFISIFTSLTLNLKRTFISQEIMTLTFEKLLDTLRAIL